MVTLVQEVKKEAETLNPSPNPFQDILRLLKTVEKDSMSDQDVITVFYSISLPFFSYNSSQFNDIILCDGPKTFLTSHYSGSLQSFEGDWQSLNFLLICLFLYSII